MAKITKEQARAVAQALELDLNKIDICLACLSFVSFPLRTGDDREVRRALASVTPHLWEEGLALPAVAALERARRAGVPHAEAALADITTRGSRSPVVREIVLRLAADLGRASCESRQKPLSPLRGRSCVEFAASRRLRP